MVLNMLEECQRGNNVGHGDIVVKDNVGEGNSVDHGNDDDQCWPRKHFQQEDNVGEGNNVEPGDVAGEGGNVGKGTMLTKNNVGEGENAGEGNNV